MPRNWNSKPKFGRNVCFNCGKEGHLAKMCPTPRSNAESLIDSGWSGSPLMHHSLEDTICWGMEYALGAGNPNDLEEKDEEAEPVVPEEKASEEVKKVVDVNPADGGVENENLVHALMKELGECSLVDAGKREYIKGMTSSYGSEAFAYEQSANAHTEYLQKVVKQIAGIEWAQHIKKKFEKAVIQGPEKVDTKLLQEMVHAGAFDPISFAG